MRKRMKPSAGLLYQNQVLAAVRSAARIAILAALCTSTSALEIPAPQYVIDPLSPLPASVQSTLTVPVSTALLGDWIKTTTSGTPVGQQAYTTAGTYSWVCPAGVTSVSAVCVGAGAWSPGTTGEGGGGGELRYKNNIAVIPGNSYTVVVGATGATGGQSYFSSTSTVCAKGGSGRTGGSGGVGDGGGNGGNGSAPNGGHSLGGGGAGGYNGTGGNGGTPNQPGTAGSGGGGGGGAGGLTDLALPGGSGGGVGLFGEGTSGSGGSPQFGVGRNGNGGSSGERGGKYGSGAAGYFGGTIMGSVGAVRIIWGPGRAFPSTNTGDM